MTIPAARPLLLSLVLHAAAGAGLLAVRMDRSVSDVPNVIEVEWVRLADGSARDVVEPSPAEGPASARTGSGPASASDAGTVETDVAEPVEAAAPQALAAEGDASAEPENEAPESNEDRPAAPSNSNEALTSAVAEAPPVDVRPSAQPSTTPVREERITAVEREMLRDRIAKWSERLDEQLAGAATAAWEHDGATYVATFTHLPAEDATDLDEALVEISTERDGHRFSTEMRVRRLAFSHYAQLVDRWDPDVQIHDDEIDGRFHSNSEIYVEHSRGVKPLFRGKVTTARGIRTSTNSRRIRREQIFVGGLETRVPRIVLPRAAWPPVDAAEIERHAIAADSRLTFHADGTYTVQPLDDEDAEERRTLGDSPAAIIAAPKAALHVKGVVNGNVLVYSPDEIVIEDDIVYASSPAGSGDDYLGLVSDGNVEVAEPDVTGPGDLVIHAAIYAKRRFIVRRYGSAKQGTLRLYGSLTAGSVSATEPRYPTKLQFDRRFEEARPPHFPMTERFELATWDGEWRVEPTLP